MKYASITDRLSGLGGDKWRIHQLGRERAGRGEDVIELTIGEPDVSIAPELIASAHASMLSGRTGYSDGRGEAGLRQALADRYSAREGRVFTPDQFMCFPGTQTSAYAVLMALTEAGDEVLVGDPMYATYEGLVRASGASMIPVPLRAENGFRMLPDDLEQCVTPDTRVLFLNTPHNPTGAVLTTSDLRELLEFAARHDLWVVSDEVYDELVFEGVDFASPLAFPEHSERVVVISSISKSHAAPGFRSGWCVGPEDFTSRLLPLSETMLFGNQPFIADMTALAVSAQSRVAEGMRNRFSRRAKYLARAFSDVAEIDVLLPDAGMFAMIDVSGTGLDGDAFATSLLELENVAVMPGSSFGLTLRGWIRVALTVDDSVLEAAVKRIRSHAARIAEPSKAEMSL